MVQTRRSLGAASSYNSPRVHGIIKDHTRTNSAPVHTSTVENVSDSDYDDEEIEYEYDSTFDSTDSLKPPKNEQDNTLKIGIGFVIIFLIAVFLSWIRFTPLDETNQYFEDFKNNIQLLRKESYPEMDFETRKTLRFIFEKAFSAQNQPPLVLAVGGNRAEEFVEDMEKILWRVQGNSTPFDAMIVNDENSRAEMHSTLKNNLIAQKNLKHMVRSARILNIDRLEWDAILVLHAFADHEHFPIPNTLLLLTISSEFWQKPGQSCDTMLSNHLLRKWTENGGTMDNVPPIISRIAFFVCI